jgi:hypothetical protein
VSRISSPRIRIGNSGRSNGEFAACPITEIGVLHD